MKLRKELKKISEIELSGFLVHRRMSIENFKEHYGKREMSWISSYQKREDSKKKFILKRVLKNKH